MRTLMFCLCAALAFAALLPACGGTPTDPGIPGPPPPPPPEWTEVLTITIADAEPGGSGGGYVRRFASGGRVRVTFVWRPEYARFQVNLLEGQDSTCPRQTAKCPGAVLPESIEYPSAASLDVIFHIPKTAEYKVHIRNLGPGPEFGSGEGKVYVGPMR